MAGRFLGALCAVMAVIGLMLMPGVAGQGSGSGAAPSTNGEGGTAPRTPWGAPDLQGIWDGSTMTPLERPEKFADREFLTDAEVKALEAEAIAEPGRNARAERGSHVDVEGAYNDVFTHRRTNVVKTRRTSLVIDPPNGRIPRVVTEAERAANARARGGRGRFGTHYTVDTENVVADHPEQRRSDRCLGITIPATASMMRIVQNPTAVGIYYEYAIAGGGYRSIALDGRPHLPGQLRQRLGHSVGRWEGETLVVDTTNFTTGTNYQGSREHLHLVERFTRTAADTIMYRITVEDSTAFTTPWTLEVPLMKRDEKKNEIFESACHEGNYSMTGILAGARALEQERAVKVR
jgi:hypothetical protein